MPCRWCDRQVEASQVGLWAVDVDLLVRTVEVAAHHDRLALAQRLQIRGQVPVPLANAVLEPPQPLPCGVR